MSKTQSHVPERPMCTPHNFMTTVTTACAIVVVAPGNNPCHIMQWLNAVAKVLRGCPGISGTWCSIPETKDVTQRGHARVRAGDMLQGLEAGQVPLAEQQELGAMGVDDVACVQLFLHPRRTQSVHGNAGAVAVCAPLSTVQSPCSRKPRHVSRCACIGMDTSRVRQLRHHVAQHSQRTGHCGQ